MKNITPTTLKLASFSDDEEEKVAENLRKKIILHRLMKMS